MKRSLKHMTVASASALAFMAMVAADASANYGGLADGNPGPADIWAASHPNFGKVMHGTHHVYEDMTR